MEAQISTKEAQISAKEAQIAARKAQIPAREAQISTRGRSKNREGMQEEPRKDAPGTKRGCIGQVNENEALVETGAHFRSPRQKYMRPRSLKLKKMMRSSRRERNFSEK